MDIEQLKFPIGKYAPNKNPNSTDIEQWIREIESFPFTLEQLLEKVSIEQLNWKYRPDGWTVKQVVHHCADSHMNSIIRFKLALTEHKPTIRPYLEDKWATLPDSLQDDLSAALLLLKGLHQKWSVLLKSLTPVQLQLEFIHPESGETINLAENIGIYAWHSNHHLAHIRNGIESMGVF